MSLLKSYFLTVSLILLSLKQGLSPDARFPAQKLLCLELQSCSKCPATFVKPVTLGKTAFFMQLSPLLCDFWVSDSMRAVYLCARSAQNVQRETKHSFSFFSHLFTPFSHFVRAFFTLVCRKETKHVKTVTDFSNVEMRDFS